MALHPIVKFLDPVLTTPAAPVTEFATPELQQLIADMFETMYAANGVGLAATQIGIARRITVIDCSVGEDTAQRHVLLNPSIIARDGAQDDEEGCLSVPGFRANVRRAIRATARAQDPAGNWMEVSGEGLLARALQHEIDHLDGVLFLSHLTGLKRDLIKRKIKKLQKNGEW
ncbi:MAG: peptide deformylase [Terriglobales bacterium]